MKIFSPGKIGRRRVYHLNPFEGEVEENEAVVNKTVLSILEQIITIVHGLINPWSRNRATTYKWQVATDGASGLLHRTVAAVIET